jgi:hypothetical protein
MIERIDMNDKYYPKIGVGEVGGIRSLRTRRSRRC